jgi:hypothetical protein
MTKEATSSYIVTPPTVFIPRDGMSFCILSRNKEWVTDTAEFLEDSMPGTTITIYANYDSTNDENWAWQFQQMLIVDAIIIDCDSATTFDQMLALSQGEANNIWWINSDNLPDNLAALLNTSGAKTAEDIEEFFSIITHGM